MKRAAPQSPRRLLAAPALVVLWAALALALAAPAGAAHPFYEEQLRRGGAALDRGDHTAAERALRLAAFGLLDDPPALAGCLVRLALARHALGDAAGAREAVERVLALEERFGAYTAAGLPAPLGASFSALVVEAVPAGRLADLAAFGDLALSAAEEELERLPAGQRRERLEGLVASEPGEPRWALLLGRLELAAGRYPRAAELAGRVLAADPASQHGLCLRGLARGGAGDCAGAVADLAACAQARTEEAVAVTHLSCLDELGRWAEARDFAAGLAPALRASRRIAKLVRRADRNAPDAATVPPAAPEPAGAAGAESPAPADEPEPGAPEAADAEPGAADPAATDSGGADGAAEQGGAAATTDSGMADPAGQGAARPDPSGTAATPPPASAPPAAPPPSSTALPPVPSPASAALDGDDEARLERARRQLASAKTVRELDEAWAIAREVADRRPGSPAAQHLAAEIAYFSSRWVEAVRYFRRGGEPERPDQLFYLAVSLYESGAGGEAAAVLEGALPRLRRTPFVEGYVERILGGRNSEK